MPVLNEVEKVAKLLATKGWDTTPTCAPFHGRGDVSAVAEHQVTSLGSTAAAEHPVTDGQNHHKTTISTQQILSSSLRDGVILGLRPRRHLPTYKARVESLQKVTVCLRSS